MFDIDKSLNKMLGTTRKRGGPKDWDGDGVPNKKDCQPRNTMRQDKVKKKIFKYDNKNYLINGKISVIGNSLGMILSKKTFTKGLLLEINVLNPTNKRNIQTVKTTIIIGSSVAITFTPNELSYLGLLKGNNVIVGIKIK